MLLGPNGAGKTTAIRIDHGRARAEPRDRAHLRLRSEPTTVRRCVAAAASCRPSRRCTTACRVGTTSSTRPSCTAWAQRYGPIKAAADRFGILEALDQQVGGYSTGMKTRLALARSVMHDPELLLFDEPTSGLDPESSHAVLNLIREMTSEGSHRGDVHAPARRSRRSGRSDRGARVRHRSAGGHAGGTDPSVLAGEHGVARRRWTPPSSIGSAIGPAC